MKSLLLVILAGSVAGLPVPQEQPLPDFLSYLEQLRDIYMNPINKYPIQDAHEGAGGQQLIDLLDQEPPAPLVPNSLSPDRILIPPANADIQWGDGRLTTDEFEAWYTPLAAFWDTQFAFRIVNPDEWATANVDGDEVVTGRDIGAALRTKTDRALFKALMSLLMWRTGGAEDATWGPIERSRWEESPIGSAIVDLPPVSDAKLKEMASDIGDAQSRNEFMMEMSMQPQEADNDDPFATQGTSIGSGMMVVMMMTDTTGPTPQPSTLPTEREGVELLPIAVDPSIILVNGEKLDEASLPASGTPAMIDMPSSSLDIPVSFFGSMEEVALNNPSMMPRMMMTTDGAIVPLTGDGAETGEREVVEVAIIDADGKGQPVLVEASQLSSPDSLSDDDTFVEEVKEATPTAPVQAELDMKMPTGEVVTLPAVVLGDPSLPGMPAPVGKVDNEGKLDSLAGDDPDAPAPSVNPSASQTEIMMATMPGGKKMTVLINSENIQSEADGSQFMTVKMPSGDERKVPLTGTTEATAELRFMPDGRLVSNTD